MRGVQGGQSSDAPGPAQHEVLAVSAPTRDHSETVMPVEGDRAYLTMQDRFRTAFIRVLEELIEQAATVSAPGRHRREVVDPPPERGGSR
jgi:hypothetical protein